MRTDDPSNTNCPIEEALGVPPKRIHDMRPAIPAWAGVWRTNAADGRRAISDRAVILAHIEGAAIEVRTDTAPATHGVAPEGGVVVLPASTTFRLVGRAPRGRVLGVVVDETLIRTGPLPVLARKPGQYALKPGIAPPHSPLAGIARVLADELQRTGPVRPACCGALIAAFLEFVVAEPALAMRTSGATPYTEDRIDRVVRLIDENICEDLSLEWLATQGGVSPYHLSRKFRESRGVTLRAFITQRRAHAACRQLAETRKPLAEIAFDCGFSSQSRMNTVFRHLLDTTPLKYRRTCWQDSSLSASE